MSKFPKSEADIRELAERMISGLPENSNFPSAPVSSSDLRNLLDAFTQKSDARMAAKAAAQQATNEKKAALKELTSAMRSDLKYAENEVHGDNAKLSTIGWGGVSPKTPLAPPGQVQMVVITRQEGGEVDMRWEEPVTGGDTASYRVEKREFTEGGQWKIAEMSVTTSITLTEQERGKEMEYRVIAVNKAGEGAASNSVMVVL